MPSIETKIRILDAAEKLFAEKGLDATSHRDLTRAAGVNLAAVNYHFGSKQAVLAAIFERRIGPINAERLARLDAAEKRGAATLDGTLRAFLGPAFERVGRTKTEHADFMRLVGRTHGETNEDVRACFIHQFDEVFERFSKALSQISQLPPRIAQLRLRFVIGSMAHLLVWHDLPGASDDDMEQLVRFAAAGFTAPIAGGPE